MDGQVMDPYGARKWFLGGKEEGSSFLSEYEMRILPFGLSPTEAALPNHLPKEEHDRVKNSFIDKMLEREWINVGDLEKDQARFAP